jgi:hypothetical protein
VVPYSVTQSDRQQLVNGQVQVFQTIAEPPDSWGWKDDLYRICHDGSDSFEQFLNPCKIEGDPDHATKWKDNWISQGFADWWTRHYDVLKLKYKYLQVKQIQDNVPIICQPLRLDEPVGGYQMTGFFIDRAMHAKPMENLVLQSYENWVVDLSLEAMSHSVMGSTLQLHSDCQHHNRGSTLQESIAE